MRKLAYIALSFSAAVFLSCFVVPYDLIIYFSVGALLVASIGVFLRKNVRTRVMLIAFSVGMGFFWFFLFNAYIGKTANAYAGSIHNFTGQVTDYPVPAKNGYSVTISIRGEGLLPVKARLYVDEDAPELSPGDFVEGFALFAHSNIVKGNETDTFYSKGIYLFAYQQGTITVTGHGGAIKYLPIRISEAIKNKTEDIFRLDTAPFMQALLTGDKSRLYDNNLVYDSLSRSGISHVVSVSGMHLAFLMQFLSMLIKNGRLKAFLGIPTVIVFMAVMGFTPSVTRAGIMQLFLIAGSLLDREPDTLTSLSASLFLILLFNPYAAASISLQMSYSAVIGMMLLSPRINKYLFAKIKSKSFPKPVSKLLYAVSATISSTLGAVVFTTPMSALYFGSVSLIAPLTNLFVLPVVSFVFCAGFVSVALGFVFEMASVLVAAVVSVFVRYIIFIASVLAYLPLAGISTSNMYIVVWLVFVYAIIVVFCLGGFRVRRLIIPGGLAALCLCAISVLTPVICALDDTMTVTALDVGQGQSIVITAGTFTGMIDCGSSSRYDAADVAEAFLSSQGRDKIDLLILTHFHSDHANGITGLIAGTNVSAIAMPVPEEEDMDCASEILHAAEKRNVEIVYITENMTAEAGNLSFTLFAPFGGQTENERGIIILCSENDYDLLVTGDIDAAFERRLIVENALPDIELLVVGHHGSRYSSCDEFLSAVTPEEAIISVGYNTYGHPTEETLDRLYSVGADVYRTDELGNVTIKAR